MVLSPFDIQKTCLSGVVDARRFDSCATYDVAEIGECLREDGEGERTIMVRQLEKGIIIRGLGEPMTHDVAAFLHAAELVKLVPDIQWYTNDVMFRVASVLRRPSSQGENDPSGVLFRMRHNWHDFSASQPDVLTKSDAVILHYTNTNDVVTAWFDVRRKCLIALHITDEKAVVGHKVILQERGQHTIDVVTRLNEIDNGPRKYQLEDNPNQIVAVGKGERKLTYTQEAIVSLKAFDPDMRDIDPRWFGLWEATWGLRGKSHA